MQLELSPAVERDAPDTVTFLVSHLDRRRRAVLSQWRRRVKDDPVLADSSKLTRAQFEDHIPMVLDALSRRLAAVGGASAERPDSVRSDARRLAAEHGSHRWQQGYDQRQTIRDWRHLHLTLVQELERIAARGAVPPSLMRAVRVEVAAACLDGVEESMAQYAEMKQAEAASRVGDLEDALRELAGIERQRLASWREAAHDLRGNVATLRTATAVLSRHDVPEVTRVRASGALRRGVLSLHELLNDLLDLSRIEAGLETRRVEPFDAARVLRELCASMQPEADRQELTLTHDGPESLPVEGDPVKVVRIAQNLILNALRYTSSGGVSVEWQAPGVGVGNERWSLRVRDTGPGLVGERASAIAQALHAATQEARQVEQSASSDASRPRDGPSTVADGPTPAAPDANASEQADPTSAGVPPNPGEGLGLSIVKRLCELLDASVGLDTSAGRGTVFRIAFPVRYDGPAPDAFEESID